MAKIECYTPDGKMEMKEPVDAREAVELCGYTMEAPEDRTIKLIRKDPPDENIVIPVENKRGRPKKDK